MMKHVLNIFFPHSPDHPLTGLHVTHDQLQGIDTYAHKSIGIEGSPQEILSVVAYRYSPLLQRAMFSIKYRRMAGMVQSVTPLLAKHIMEELRPGMVLCPVPLHWVRYLDRGFNQSALIAEQISEQTKLPVRKLLRRTRDTGHQAWRSREDRLHAMSGAFALRKLQKLPRHVVLIDDIATTGATLHECAKILENAGVRRVDAWVIGRG